MGGGQQAPQPAAPQRQPVGPSLTTPINPYASQQQPVNPYAPQPAQPAFNLNAHFTEPPVAQNIQVSGALSPQQAEVARRMGMTAEQYLAWHGGVPTR